MRSKNQAQKQSQIHRAKGYSIKEIATTLNVSKSSVSVWVRCIALSSNAQKRIKERQDSARKRASATLHQRKIDRENIAMQTGRMVVRNAKIDENTARIICSMIYWCEGNKNAGDGMGFTNSDPRIIETFLSLLRTGFLINESKFRACIHIHDYHNEAVQLKFWSEKARIPEGQFTKSFKKPHTGKQTHLGYQGCIQIRYRDVVLSRELLAIGEVFMEKNKGL